MAHIKNTRGFYLEDYDNETASWTAFKECSINFESMISAKRTATRLNTLYGWRCCTAIE